MSYVSVYVYMCVDTRSCRRWNNERVLRELAGPMSAEEMHSHFNPVPFGEDNRSSSSLFFFQ